MAGHAHARIGGERGEHVVEAAQVHNDKRTALLIAVLALFLALVETGGKGAQTTALSANIEASDLWAFFQARTVRQTVVRTAAEMAPLLADPARAAEVEAQAGRWRADERRWESEPEKGDGRRELAERAKAAERARDRAIGVCQRSCPVLDQAASLIVRSFVSRSGLRQTSPTGDQLRIWRDHRAGLAARASV
jgi:hypothetical protein